MLFFADMNFQNRMMINGTGAVTCNESSPPLVIPVQDASDLYTRADCDQGLDARGFNQACGDIGRCGCSMDGAAFGGLLALGLLLLSRRSKIALK